MSGRPTVFMFSGLGSHYYHMARPLYERRPVFREAMDKMDAVAFRETGRSVLAALFDPARGKADVMDRSSLALPAIVMVEYALAQTLGAQGVRPDLVLGASAGSIAAAAVAGCISAEDALRTAINQSAILETHCEAGAMVAVLDRVDRFTDTGLDRYSELAALNSDMHFVVATTMDRLPEVVRLLRLRRLVHQRLAVSIAYHSRWVEPARWSALEHLRSLSWARPTMPLVCSARAAVLDRLPADHFWTVAREPVQFARTIRYLEGLGPHQYIDVGPSGTLANFVRQLLVSGSQSTLATVLSPFGGELANLARIEKPAALHRDTAVAAHGTDATTTAVGQTRPPGTVSPVARAARRNPTAFIFPGQGSQHRGMGADLFDAVPEYRRAEREIDDLLGYSMRALCLEGPDGRLNDTRYTQPSMYVVNALHYYRAVRDGAVPNYVAGHSLGEYNALLAAGVFDLVGGLHLVNERAKRMAQVGAGAMAAVVGLDPGRVAAVIEEHGLGAVDIANFNAPTQVVVSGPRDEIVRAAEAFEVEGARVVQLRVTAAFHSRYMTGAAGAFEKALAPRQLAAAAIPVVCNVTGLPLPAGEPTATIKSLLVRQITHPVRWTQSVQFLLANGVTEFHELGPGRVLTGLVQQVREEASPSDCNGDAT